MTSGIDVLDALIAGVNLVELDPEESSVGYGRLPNADGVVQLDSCCMHGARKRAGGVAALDLVAALNDLRADVGVGWRSIGFTLARLFHPLERTASPRRNQDLTPAPRASSDYACGSRDLRQRAAATTSSPRLSSPVVAGSGAGFTMLSVPKNTSSIAKSLPPRTVF